MKPYVRYVSKISYFITQPYKIIESKLFNEKAYSHKTSDSTITNPRHFDETT